MVEQEREGEYVLIYVSRNGHVADSGGWQIAGMSDYVSVGQADISCIVDGTYSHGCMYYNFTCSTVKGYIKMLAWGVYRSQSDGPTCTLFLAYSTVTQ